jgi:hypothetical protein
LCLKLKAKQHTTANHSLNNKNKQNEKANQKTQFEQKNNFKS